MVSRPRLECWYLRGQRRGIIRVVRRLASVGARGGARRRGRNAVCRYPHGKDTSVWTHEA